MRLYRITVRSIDPDLQQVMVPVTVLTCGETKREAENEAINTDDVEILHTEEITEIDGYRVTLEPINASATCNIGIPGEDECESCQ